MESKHIVSHPKQFSIGQWWEITKRVFDKVQKDNMPLIAAGVAFYFLLAVFPLFAALISMYGFFVEQETLTQHINILMNVLPAEGKSVLEEQIKSLISADGSALSISFIVGFILTIWSGGKGSAALIIACNIAYQESEARSIINMIIARIILTFATVFFMLFMLMLVVFIPLIFSYVDAFSHSMLAFITWPILLLSFSVSLSCLYKYAPHRKSAKWRWVIPGALMATFLWIVGSIFFNFYITHYAGYNKTYGSMGGVVILLMWFYVTAYTVLLGAEINAASELQTFKDTTTGNEKPIGNRGAYVADNGPETQ